MLELIFFFKSVDTVKEIHVHAKKYKKVCKQRENPLLISSLPLVVCVLIRERKTHVADKPFIFIKKESKAQCTHFPLLFSLDSISWRDFLISTHRSIFFWNGLCKIMLVALSSTGQFSIYLLHFLKKLNKVLLFIKYDTDSK